MRPRNSLSSTSGAGGCAVGDCSNCGDRLRFKTTPVLRAAKSRRGTVTEAGQEKFQRYLGRANAVLQSSAGFAAGDPEYDVENAVVSGRPDVRSVEKRVARDEHAASKENTTIGFRVSGKFPDASLVRRSEEYRRYAEWAAQVMGDQGDETYGRLGYQAFNLERKHPSDEDRFLYATDLIGLACVVAYSHSPTTSESQRSTITPLPGLRGRPAIARQHARCFSVPSFAWTEEASGVWVGSAYYQRARDWALKSQWNRCDRFESDGGSVK